MVYQKKKNKFTQMLNCYDMSSKNSNEDKSFISKDNISDLYKCYKCGQLFNTINLLMNHRQKYHPSKTMCRNIDTCKFELNCWYLHTNETNEKGCETNCTT